MWEYEMDEPMTRVDQLEKVVEEIEKMTKDSPMLDALIDVLIGDGIEPAMHVGKEAEWFKRDENRTAEWLMGQFVEGHVKKDYLAYNTCVNLSKSFLEGTYPIGR